MSVNKSNKNNICLDDFLKDFLNLCYERLFHEEDKD